MKRYISYVLALLCLSVMAGVPTLVNAQTCSASASAVNFGSVNPIALNAVSTTGTVTVTCTWPKSKSTPNVQVCLNLDGTSPRTLISGTNGMQYDLYQDTAHSLAWGSISAGTTPISLTLTQPANDTATEIVTVYGQIAANQPTVPTTGNSSTVYTESFSSSATSLNYGFYKNGRPSCASLTTKDGSFAFTANATVIPDCNISTTNVSFAASSLLTSALSATGSITARCTNNDAWQIALNGGSSGNVAARTMQRAGGGATVSYQLYIDAAHTSPWGDGTAGTLMQTGTGTGNQQVITIYGVVPAQRSPEPGNYTDTIMATISF